METSSGEVWWDSSTVVLVTGANKGIGCEIAAQLGELGLTVVVTSRSEALGQAALASLQAKVPQGRFEYLQLDITDDASIARCAEDVRTKFGKLTVLVNNAGMAYKGNIFGADEAAQTINCNLKGTRRVCEAMLPLLGPNARIINVSSRAGKLGQLRSDELKARFVNAANANEVEAAAEQFVQAIRDGDHESKGWSNSMYGISKLAETAYSRVLARELEGKGIMVNACCPGWCATDMSSHSGPRTASQGAESPVWLATLPVAAPGAEGFLTGQFFADKAVCDW